MRGGESRVASTCCKRPGSINLTDIAFLLPAANGGGAERAMISVANRFAASGIKVDMVLVRKSGPFLAEISPDIRIVDLEAGKIRKALMPLHRYLKREKPPLLVSSLVGGDALALAGKALMRWKTHLHISVQNSPSASEGVSGDWLARRWPTLIRTLYRYAQSISAISQGVADDVERLMNRPAGSVPVINNPVDIETVRARAGGSPDHPWLLDKKGPVVLAVGRLVKQKDLATLLAAFAAVRARRPDARLLVLGEGSERPTVEAEVARLGLGDAVALPGFSANPFAAMATADVFVLASRWEGFANVVAEALACGAKVVSTDCPSGPAEILDNGRFGRLVPIGDAQAMADAIVAAIGDDVDRGALVERARHYELSSIVDQYRALFNRMGFLR